jgi:glycine/D-amino acid oxidase-like deaminating enzyme
MAQPVQSSDLIMNSYWLSAAKSVTNSASVASVSKGVERSVANYPKLASVSSAKHYDVCVIGGGIVGCTAAYLLKKKGAKVCLIEGRNIGGGTTGFSTAKLTSQQNLIYSSLAKLHNKETAKLYWEMNEKAIRFVDELVSSGEISCDYSSRSHFTWTSNSSKESEIRKEYELTKELGIPSELLEEKALTLQLPSTINPKLAVKFPNQAIFNSYKYCLELSKLINGNGSDVFEDSLVSNVGNSAPHSIELQEEEKTVQPNVTSDNVILATHLPFLDRSMHFTILQPYRSHCIAFQADQANQAFHLHDMCINCDEPMRSLRTDADDNIIILSGGSIQQGEVEDSAQFFEDLEKWAKEHFHVVKFLNRWSAMDYHSTDQLPYIGYLYRGSKSLFTATGFKKWSPLYNTRA